MKRTLSLLTLCLAVVACSSATQKFSAEFQKVTEDQKARLPDAIARMIEGRVLSMEKELIGQSFAETENGGTLTVTVSDEETATGLREQLVDLPFSFRIMTQAEAGQGDIVTEQFGEFAESGITEAHVDWVTALVPTGGDAGGASLTVTFTPEGQELLKNVFAANEGKMIGIFVRGRLMSLKQVEPGEANVSISIDNVPSAQIASSFADDVNVSVHVSFTAQ